ncbi:MAG TPA: hypothetical protein PLP29_06325 [Candidatus Ozemobacteraceae bacterium]|nr:hypothetical protein [Candidatus Ozemobacteraceae bacterium]
MTDTTLPATLDQAEWLKLGLSSAQPLERLLAIEEIAFQGLVGDFSGPLDRIAVSDDSDLCRARAEQLLTGHRKRQIDRKIEKVELTPERTRALLEVGEETLKRIVQLSLRRPPAPDVLEAWRSSLLGEESPEVVRVGLTLLAKFGTAADAALALAFTGHASPAVVTAAIDLLHAQSLDQFKERIVQFLTADDLEIRLHAIRKLRSFDPAEAQVYLRSLLSARDPLIRQRGLRELLLVPFAETEALYLAYLAAEPAPLLLVLAGSAVAMNPSPDLPLKLYDIFAAARGTRAHILQLVIRQLLTTIKESGILQEPIDSYLEKLKTTLEQRKLQTTCRLALDDLTHEDPEVRLEAIRKLRAGIGLPNVREALERHLPVESSEEAKELLQQILGTAKEEFTAEGLRQKVRDGSFHDLDPKAQKRYLAVIRDSDTFKELRETIGILLLAKLDRSVLLHLFDRISSFGQAWDPKPLFPHLKHEDPGVVAAALRTIGRFDPDCISYEIPNFLRHDDVRVKTAALELYLVSDKASALQYLAGMLKAPALKLRKNGLSLLATVDFPSAQRLLQEYIPTERNVEARIQAAFILAANPTREGFRLLYECSHDKDGILLPAFQDLWDSAIAGAIPLLAPDIAALMADLQPSQAPTPAPEADKQPAYAFRKVTASSTKNLYGEKDPLAGQALAASDAETQAREVLDRAASSADRNRMVLAAAAVVLVMAGLWWLAGDRIRLPGAGDGRPAVVHESSAVRMEESGGDAPAMVAGTRGSAGQFLTGSSYANTMKSMHAERLSISLEFARKSEAALNDTLRQMSVDPNYRGYAEFYLNENCKLGLECIEKGNYPEAREYLLKALDDPAITEEARVLVCQSLLGIGYEVGDKVTLEKAMDRLLSMIPEKDLPKEYSRQAVKEAFAGLDRMKEITPEQFSQIMQKLAKDNPGRVPPEAQAQMLEGFKQMRNRFK